MIQDTTLPVRTASEPQLAAPRWCIHEIFEAQACETPNAVAVSFGGERLTYRELNARANQLARYLRTLGVCPETPVALYLDRSPTMVVAILGVLKAGGAYVPIDLAYPFERLSFMLEDSQASILLTEQNLLGKLPPDKTKVISLDSEWNKIAEEPAEDLQNLAGDQNAAYIIYTSGSTGKPKGVVVTHRNVVRLLKRTEHWYGFNTTDVWPLFHSYAFDVSVWELWGCLFYGGRLVIVPYLVTRSPREFYQLLAKEKVTVLNQTPSAFRQLVWAEETAETKLELHLRYVICAGEALELQSLKPWFARHGDQRPSIVNKYGITETTVHSTYRVIRQGDLTNGMGSVIGVPIPDLQLYLLDEDLKPVPAGVSGEIFVGGAGVARGYLNRPELTSQRFLTDPFSSQPDARLYRSGDLAQINANGELEYLGRIDHQVKIRGFRVELGEIESALNRHTAIRESAVIAHDTQAGEKRLVAYVVPVQAAPTVTELREHLATGLPDYMLPASFVFLRALPLTTNGKVDRRALPKPDGARPQLRTEYVAPATPTEQALAQIWANVLGIDKVGIHDNFFELGGDSIRSITILAQAQKHGWRLSLDQIFQNPTVAALAKCAESAARRDTFKPTEPFSLISPEDKAKLPAGVEDAYPLTRLQLGMFYYNELDPVSAMYHDVFSYRVQAALDQDNLHQAVARLVERHPLLRTSFHLAGFSQPLQLVHREVSIPFTFEDLREVSTAEQDRRLVDWIEAEKRRPFNRSAPPLCRFHVQHRDDKCFQFIISFHHSCLDGWSLAAVITEIFQDYTALRDGSERATSAPVIAYRDFVVLEQQAINSDACRRFWTEKITDLSPNRLPRWPQSALGGAHEQQRGPEVHLEPGVLGGLRALAQAAAVPLKTVLLAAHQRVMGLLYGQTDVTTGLICNGRPEELDGEKLVGLFLNNLPLRQKLAGGTWLDLVKQTFAAEQELLPQRRFPLAEVQKLAGGQPLFETAFDFVHFHVLKGLEALPDLSVAESHYFEANNLTTYTTFMLDVTSTDLELHIDYDPNALCRRQIEQITTYYLQTLRDMAANPEARYDRFSPLSDSERTRLLVEWNATEEDYPRAKCIHELFEERVAENPQASALVFAGQTLSYRELNEKAEAVAAHLRAVQFGPEELVAICVDRSPEMVIGLLGILKAGGAYVPLDPAYPKERLTYMLTDSKARLVLTQTKLLAALSDASTQLLSLETLLSTQAAPLGFTGDKPTAFGPTGNRSASSWGPPARAEGRAEQKFVLPPSEGAPGNGQSPRSSYHSPLAYVIYTSGSTGKPKGVQVTHRSVVNVLTSIARKTNFASTDNLLAVTTLSFDIAALELFLPLITGGTLTLASREIASDGTKLAALIESSNATAMQGTPATWRLLIESGWQRNERLKIFCGGEALKRELADQLLDRGEDVWNFYGPTETTIWSTAWKVARNAPISIGRPLANTALFILDDHLQPVPVGTVGELYIAGDGLARGYLNRDNLTAERFILNPFAKSASDRMYKTGDLARYLPDSQIECLGRIDYQVKIRGFRIELGEVEAVLRQHSAIADALVTARDDALGEKRLIGYIISHNGPPSTPELRDFVQTRLPLYMVPAHFVLLKQFPLTPNGKIDSRQLPAPESATQPTRPYIAPRTPDEQLLSQIWGEVLELKQIGIDDNFFELGGDSLSATRTFARINRSFGMALTLQEILEHPTIRSLGELVSKNKGSAPAAASVIPRRPRRTA